eukprot:3005448-Amphidinium_carterae.1
MGLATQQKWCLVECVLVLPLCRSLQRGHRLLKGVPLVKGDSLALEISLSKRGAFVGAWDVLSTNVFLKKGFVLTNGCCLSDG